MKSDPQSERLTLRRLAIVESHFALKRPHDGNAAYHLALVGFSKVFDPDRGGVAVRLDFDAFFEVENPVLEARFSFAVRYEAEGDREKLWASLKDHIVLAHCVPYVREFLSSMTTRMPITPLTVDMVNTHAMFEDFEKRSSNRTPSQETRIMASPSGT